MATPSPKPARLHRLLHLQHRSHTGRLLHHRHTSYRSLAVVLVLAGAFMIGFNFLARATADTITVYAQLLAEVPTDPAIITSPVDGTQVTKSRLTVSGTCPQMREQGTVAILDNGTLIGSVACDSDNTFSLEVQLRLGNNRLIARTYTITNEAGPDSPPVTITYNEPSPVAITVPEDTTANSRTYQNDLSVIADAPFIIFSPEKDAEWSGTITGGQLPYSVTFDWGDGSSSHYTVHKIGRHSFSHHYTVMQTYSVLLQVRDAAGRGVQQMYAAVTPYRSPISSIIYTTPGPRHFQGSTPLAIYATYLILIAGFGVLWIMTSPGAFAYAKVTHGTPALRRSQAGKPGTARSKQNRS